MEIFAEQSIVNDKIDKHSKRTRVLRYLRNFCIVAVVIVFFIMLNITLVDHLLSGFLLFLAISAPFVCTFIVLRRFIINSNLEYDYLLNGGTFRIVKVIQRKKRKMLVETSVSSFESIGRVTSENYDKYAKYNNVKKSYAICGDENEDDVFYIFFNLDGVPQLVHIVPNEAMVAALRRCVSRITILDKSFNMVKKDVVSG